MVKFRPHVKNNIFSSYISKIGYILAHLAERYDSLWYGTASVRPSVRRQLFPLTTRPISTKLCGNDAWEKGI